MIVRNLPAEDDLKLVRDLHNAFGLPFRHLKRVRGYGFITFFAEEDMVEIVRRGQIMLGDRPIVCDFLNDNLWIEY